MDSSQHNVSQTIIGFPVICFAESGPVDTENVLAGSPVDVHAVSTWLQWTESVVGHSG
jgi:hypothetical protein